MAAPGTTCRSTSNVSPSAENGARGYSGQGSGTRGNIVPISAAHGIDGGHSAGSFGHYRPIVGGTTHAGTPQPPITVRDARSGPADDTLRCIGAPNRASPGRSSCPRGTGLGRAWHRRPSGPTRLGRRTQSARSVLATMGESLVLDSSTALAVLRGEPSAAAVLVNRLTAYDAAYLAVAEAADAPLLTLDGAVAAAAGDRALEPGAARRQGRAREDRAADGSAAGRASWADHGRYLARLRQAVARAATSAAG